MQIIIFAFAEQCILMKDVRIHVRCTVSLFHYSAVNVDTLCLSTENTVWLAEEVLDIE